MAVSPFTTTTSVAPSTGESTLSVTRADLKASVRRFSNYARTGTLTDDQVADIDEAIADGERWFYAGRRLPGESMIHAWSFLTIEITIAIAEAQVAFDLPANFARFTEPKLSYTDSTPYDLQIVGPAEFYELRQKNVYLAHYADHPTHGSVIAQESDRSDGQRYSLQVWPIPTQDVTLIGPVAVNPYATTDSTPYPLGGMFHAATLKAAVLAAFDLNVNDNRGEQWENFMELYAGSVAYDRKAGTKPYFGKNLDRSCRQVPYRRHRGQGVTYSGNA